jgi:hypothetical protein
MCDSSGEVWLRPSDFGAAPGVPTASDWRESPDLHVIAVTTRWAVTDAGRPDTVSDRAAAVEKMEGWPGGCHGKGGDMPEYLIAFNDVGA